MKSQIEQAAPSILAEINKASRILMHFHPHYDPDSTGSVLALKEACENMGKTVTVILGDDRVVKEEFMHLKGITDAVAANFSDISIGDYDLFISLDSASPSQISRVATPSFPLPIRTIVIDHHATNPEYGDLNLVVNSFSSTCEIVYWLLKAWDQEITRSMAMNLFTGMWSDTGGFMYASTTASTYQAAGELVGTGLVPADAVFPFIGKTNQQLRAIGKVLENVQEFCNGHVAFFEMPRSLITDGIIANDEWEPVKEMLKTLMSYSKTAAITALLYEGEEGVNISLRSNNRHKPVDVSKIAIALGGGGHIAAAACRIKGVSMLNAQTILERTIFEMYPEWK